MISSPSRIDIKHISVRRPHVRWCGPIWCVHAIARASGGVRQPILGAPAEFCHFLSCYRVRPNVNVRFHRHLNACLGHRLLEYWRLSRHGSWMPLRGVEGRSLVANYGSGCFTKSLKSSRRDRLWPCAFTGSFLHAFSWSDSNIASWMCLVQW